MSAASPKRRQRIVRVRHVQHLQAGLAAAAAQEKVDQLQTSADRLVTLRGSLLDLSGATTGAFLAHKHELAQRLDQARHGLTDAIVGAEKLAEQKAEARMEARRQQESAEKLAQRAEAQFQRMIELKAMAQGRRRRAAVAGDEGAQP